MEKKPGSKNTPLEKFISFTAFWKPEYILESAWLEHAPFAFWLIEALQPDVFVELGSHLGYSYFAFCQAVESLGLNTRCYAVDHWEGDEHAGFYDDSVYMQVHRHNEENYTHFSTLIRASFDDALDKFKDASIDLLHIDGRHFYEDVKHDFELWKPKLSDKAVVLFHDTAETKKGFGVYKLWEELEQEYPSFQFFHGHGLGVLGIGEKLPQKIDSFFKAVQSPETAISIRQIYGRLGKTATYELSLNSTEAQLQSEKKRSRDLNNKIKEQDAKISEQDAKISEQDAKISEQDAKIKKKKNQIDTLETELHKHKDLVNSIKKSSSWRLTAPLRAAKRVFRWLLRNLKRVLKLLWWIFTFQFGKVSQTAVPFLKKHLPPVIKKNIPKRIKKSANKKYSSPGITWPKGFYKSPDGKKALVAEKAFRKRDWKTSLSIWKDLLKNTNRTSVKLNGKFYYYTASVLSDINGYRESIFSYKKEKDKRDSNTRKIAVFTVISNNYDSLKMPATINHEFDYFVFSDTAMADAGVWEIKPITYFNLDPTRSARFIKTHPHLLLQEYDIAIWIDSNIMIVDNIDPIVQDFLSSGKPVAAVPHPLRATIYEELEACINLSKEQKDSMTEQISHYRSIGFEHDDLIESNFMIFDLNNPKVASFLNTWWTEINTYSRRDQLSLNYALQQTGIEWHPLTERPDSIRNHPKFALVAHDNGEGPAREILEYLYAPLVDPYSGPAYSTVLQERIEKQHNRAIDIVVCVHNALDDVRQCLDSIVQNRSADNQKLIIVDDGSEAPTETYLKDFSQSLPWVSLIRNEHASGYTRAANAGLKASSGDFVLLLNSDTIVTSNWAEKMADAVFSTPGAGVVGPLSSAASHQSIPDHLSTQTQTAINPLPPGLSAEDMNRYCEQWSHCDILPRTPLVHGFCFGITREALDTIGYFDEHKYPKGYGEENDYCFRTEDTGFGLVVATHTYIFHKKSKSYVGPERVSLMRAGSKQLEETYGKTRIYRAVKSMQENPLLIRFREKARTLYEAKVDEKNAPIEIAHTENGSTEQKMAAFLPIRSNNTFEGTVYIRVVLPLQHSSIRKLISFDSILKKNSFHINNSHNGVLVARDAIRSEKQAKKIIKDCQNNKIPLIYEIDDDLINLPDEHPAKKRFTPKVVNVMKKIIKNADAVIVSTEKLKSDLSRLNNNVFLLPNALDETLWTEHQSKQPETKNDQKVSILYMGTRTHDSDLAIVLDALKKLKNKYGNDVEFYCIGGFSQKMSDLFTNIDIPAEAQKDYPSFVRWFSQNCDFNIAIAPLENNEFNQRKSYIKCLDYGICALPVIASDMPQYRKIITHERSGLLVANTTDAWFDALSRVIENKDLRNKLGKILYKEVVSKHTLEAQASQRKKLWKELLRIY